jgi:hypothetical protein
MLSVVQTIKSQMVEWLKNDKLKRMWKETVVAYLKVLSRNCHGEIEENHEIPQSK